MANLYASYADLSIYFDTREIAQLSADDNSGGLTQATIETIIDAAASWMDSIIGGRATIVAGSVPPVLTMYVCAKAMKMCLLRRGGKVDAVDAAAKDADDWAANLIKGTVTIPTYAPPGPKLVHSSSGSPEVARTDSMQNDVSFPQGVPVNPRELNP